MTEALQLWARACGKEDFLKPSTNSFYPESIRKTLKDIKDIDESIFYLRKVQRGGIVEKLLYRLETVNLQSIRNAFHYKSIYKIIKQFNPSGSFISICEETGEHLKSLEGARREIVRELGGLLSDDRDDRDDRDGITNHSYSETTQLENRKRTLILIRPSWISKCLLPMIAGTIVGYFSIRLLYRIDWRYCYELSLDLYTGVKYLILDWIINPMKDIWKTVRYRSNNLALVSAAALKSDMDSLERMILAFARKQYPNIPQDRIVEQVRRGDVTLLLQRYEEELHSPIKNALTGDLISMLLIQVQKSKVDLESALVAMDRLLKANELNFELLAVIPLLALLYLLVGGGRYRMNEWMNQSERYYQNSIREKIHDLQVVLNSSRAEMEILGESFIIIQSILDDWKHLSAKPVHSNYHYRFQNDLSELIVNFNSKKKLWTISRMLTFYPFLQVLV